MDPLWSPLFTAAVAPSLTPPDTVTPTPRRPTPRKLGTEAQWRWKWRYGGGPWCPERCSRMTVSLQTSLGKPRLCGWRVVARRTWTCRSGGTACSFPLNTPDSRSARCVPADCCWCLRLWRCCCRRRQCLLRRSTPPPSTQSPEAPPCTGPGGSAQTGPGAPWAGGPTTPGSPSCCLQSDGALSWQCWGQRSNNRQLNEKTRNKIIHFSNYYVLQQKLQTVAAVLFEIAKHRGMYNPSILSI